MTPKQRGAGQTGGHGGHRKNIGAFRASGGSVKPPKKGCALIALLMLTSPVLAAVGMVYYHTA